MRSCPGPVQLKKQSCRPKGWGNLGEGQNGHKSEEQLEGFIKTPCAKRGRGADGGTKSQQLRYPLFAINQAQFNGHRSTLTEGAGGIF